MGRRNPTLSARDEAAPLLADVEISRLWAGLMRILLTGSSGQIGSALRRCSRKRLRRRALVGHL